jgi:hypothetical protein
VYVPAVVEAKEIVPVFATPGLTTNVPLAGRVTVIRELDFVAEKFMEPATPNG